MKDIGPALRKAVTLALFGYVVFVLVLFLGQRSVLYHPNGIVPDPAQAGVPEMSALRLTTDDGMKPLAWWAPPAREDDPVVIYFHGNAGHIGNRAGQARMFLDAGYGVLLAGYRYNAGAGGDPGEDGLIADGRAAVQFVLGEGIAASRLVLYGESLGTGIAVALATEYDVGALVLDKPYSSIADIAQDIYWYVPARWLVLDRFDSLSRINNVDAPLLIIHGENDTLIPARLARALFDAAPEPKEGHFLPGGNHGNLYRLGAGELVLEFLERRIGQLARN